MGPFDSSTAQLVCPQGLMSLRSGHVVKAPSCRRGRWRCEKRGAKMCPSSGACPPGGSNRWQPLTWPPGSGLAKPCPPGKRPRPLLYQLLLSQTRKARDQGEHLCHADRALQPSCLDDIGPRKVWPAGRHPILPCLPRRPSSHIRAILHHDSVIVFVFTKIGNGKKDMPTNADTWAAGTLAPPACL